MQTSSKTLKTYPALLLIGLPWLSLPLHAQTLAPEVLLSSHNQYREPLGIAPLIWSDELAASAQQWADQLAASNRFQHSDTRYGENLWMGTASAYSQAKMVQSWGDERQAYVHGVFPNVTTGGVVGHYTQIIWRRTQKVGCGLATGHGNDVLVCQYDPPGNWRGESPY